MAQTGLMTSTDVSLVQVHLDRPGIRYLLRFAIGVETDPQQPIARQQPRSFTSRVSLDCFRRYAFFCIDPSDSIPSWRFMFGSLAEIKNAGAYQKRRANEQKPSLGC